MVLYAFAICVANACAALPAVPTIPARQDSVARVIERLPLHTSAFYILNDTRAAALLLRDTSIVLQLTDRGLEEVDRDVKRAKADGVLSRIIHGALAGAVTTMMDHGIEYSLRDLKEARVDKGVLVLESKSGNRVFGSVSVNDRNVIETFREVDARRFAKRVNDAATKVCRKR
jgi:hypothetical protein